MSRQWLDNVGVSHRSFEQNALESLGETAFMAFLLPEISLLGSINYPASLL